MVRAFTKGGGEGQASVAVTASGEAGADELPTHVVKEGETWESIAGDNGITEEELIGYNPRLTPGDPQPGETVAVPGDSSAEGEAGGREAPRPLASQLPSRRVIRQIGRGIILFLRAYPFLQPIELFLQALPFQPEPEPTLLRVEALNLQTDGPFEQLHCYVSLANGDPRWYPDSDHNQSTDESFEAGWGGRVWNIAPFLSGESVPMVAWPDDQAVPFSINCVGVAGGGMDAVNLGTINTSVQPEMWGVVQRAESTGGERRFAINYQVSRVAQAKELDPNMTAPTNARFYELTLFCSGTIPPERMKLRLTASPSC